MLGMSADGEAQAIILMILCENDHIGSVEQIVLHTTTRSHLIHTFLKTRRSNQQTWLTDQGTSTPMSEKRYISTDVPLFLY